MDYTNPRLKSLTSYVDMEGTFTPAEDGIHHFGVIVAGTGQLFIDGERGQYQEYLFRYLCMCKFRESAVDL